jgi:hypothetical protein
MPGMSAMRTSDRVSRLLLIVLGLVLLSTASALPARAQDDTPATNPTRLEGYLKLIEGDNWWVGDAQVVVTEDTVIIEKRGQAEVGAWVVVQGPQAPGGPILAELVMVERPAGMQGVLWPFSGLLTKQAEDLWVINDVPVRVTPETDIRGAPRPGWLVWVIAEQPPDALELQALVIEAIASDPSQVPVEFEGVLEAMEPEWRVAGQTFRLSPQVVTIGELVVGQQVEVQAIVQPDDSLVAYLIRAVDTSADARLSALVAGIANDPDGHQTWDLIIFPPSAWTEPVIGTAHVSANALVDESRAVAQAGQWAELQGITIGLHQYEADVIRLDQPVPAAVSGELRQAGTTAWWTIDGMPVWLGSARLARLAAQAEGDVVIRGVRLNNGVLWAERITSTATMIR